MTDNSLKNILEEWNNLFPYEKQVDFMRRKTAELLGMDNFDVAEDDEIDDFMRDYEAAKLTLKLYLKCYIESSKANKIETLSHADLKLIRNNVKDALSAHLGVIDNYNNIKSV